MAVTCCCIPLRCPWPTLPSVCWQQILAPSSNLKWVELTYKVYLIWLSPAQIIDIRAAAAWSVWGPAVSLKLQPHLEAQLPVVSLELLDLAFTILFVLQIQPRSPPLRVTWGFLTLPWTTLTFLVWCYGLVTRVTILVIFGHAQICPLSWSPILRLSPISVLYKGLLCDMEQSQRVLRRTVHYILPCL